MAKHRKHASDKKHAPSAVSPDLTENAGRRRLFDIAVIVLLFIFGAWLSWNYFGHKLVPSSDFPGFVAISRQLLSGHAPVNYKRAPVHGALVAGISLFTQSSVHPDLTAGWILNAILYPFIGVFLYLIARRFIGLFPAAIFAVICAVNTWTLYMLRDPICEIDLLFFFVLAFYLIVIRSRWCYLVAAIGSMVRYEAAGIIVCAFLVDIVSTRDRKQWLKSAVCAAIALIPLAIWLAATFTKGLKPGDTHYLSELGEYSGRRSPLEVVTKDLPIQLNLLWQVAYQPLFLPPAYVKSLFVRPSGLEAQAINSSFHMVQFVAAFTFLCGVIYAAIKRNWHIVAMVLFLLMYLLVHALHSFAFPRFLTAVYWIALLVSCLGLQGIWRLINGQGRIPVTFIWILQAILALVVVIWVGRMLWPVEVRVGTSIQPLSIMNRISARSTPALYAALAAAVLCSAAAIVLLRSRSARMIAVTLAVTTAMLFSNQFSIATTLRSGGEDDEFRQAAEWYRSNAKPGEVLACSMFMVMATIDEKNSRYFVPLPTTGKGPGDPQKFTEMCLERGLTYVVWDSRLGFAKNDRYYWMNGLNSARILADPRSIGPFEYLTTLKSDYSGRYVHIFRLLKPEAESPPPPAQ